MLNEDTKIDLSGEIDSNPATESQESSSGKKIFGGMSLPVPINISQVRSPTYQNNKAPIKDKLGQPIRTLYFSRPSRNGLEEGRAISDLLEFSLTPATSR